MEDQYNEREALRLMAQGEESGFRQIYDRYFGSIFLFALKYLKSDALAKDITQEVFLTLLDKKSFTSIGQFEFYLHIIARNKCFDYLKQLKARNKASEEFAHDLGSVDAARERAEHLEEIERMEKLIFDAIEKMPPRRREIFIMKKLEGLSYAVIAKRMGISELTVQPSLKAGMKDLSDHLKHNLGAYIISLFALYLAAV